MNCQEIQETLSSLMAESLPPEIASHLEECSECREVYRDFLQLRKLLLHYSYTLGEEWERANIEIEDSWASFWIGLVVILLIFLLTINYLIWKVLEHYSQHFIGS